MKSIEGYVFDLKNLAEEMEAFANKAINEKQEEIDAQEKEIHDLKNKVEELELELLAVREMEE